MGESGFAITLLSQSDRMNAATKENQNIMANPANPLTLPTPPTMKGDTTFEDEEEEELEEEVLDLKDDKTYHDFITNVVEHKEIAEEDEKLDGDFVVEDQENQPPAVVDDNKEEEGAESDGSSTLTEDEDDADEKEVVQACSDVLETKIPKEALREAEKRFPHFWRTKHALKTEYMEGAYQEEQDPDYEPEKDKEVDLDDTQDAGDEESAALETSANAGGEDWRQAEEVELEGDDEPDEFEEEEDPEAMKAELTELEAEKEKDLKGEVSGLVEMVEYMTVVVGDQVSSAEAKPAAEDSGSVASPVSSPVAVADTAASEADHADDGGEADDEGEDMEDEQNIGELELDGYVSAEDPDFPEPSEEDFEAANDSHPDTDDEMAVEHME